MKKNKQLGIIVVVAVAIVVIMILIANAKYNKQEDTGEEIPVLGQEKTVIQGEKLAEIKTYNGLEVSNVKFTINDKMTVLTADARNTTSQYMEGHWVNINVLDKDGNKITSIGGYIDDVEPGGTTPISSGIVSDGGDLKAYDIEITGEREVVQPESNTEDIENTEN